MKTNIGKSLTPRKLKPFMQSGKSLSVSLLQALEDELGTTLQLGDFDSGKAIPIAGAELDYKHWLKSYARHSANADLAEHHIRAWEWAEKLTPGASAPALIECWFRGGGKSTTVELIISRLAVKATRRFALYVCHTQDAANRHVNDIASAMEKCGIERAVNQYGFSKGWSASKLRTSNGFNVLAFGLDTGARGVKLDHLRPDIIIFDDIDELDDSVDRVEKKIKTMTATILPARSIDCAVIFVQNAIHSNSVMTRTLSGEIDMLQNRIQSPKVPAIWDLTYTPCERDNGRVGYKITGGTPAWKHKNIEVCQDEIDTFGLTSFLRECQHDVGVGGRFFPQFREYDNEGNPWHVVDHVEIQPWWRFWASHDYGTGAPACTILFASDERENVYLLSEWYEAGHVSSSQATNVAKMLEQFELAKCVSKERNQWATKLEAIAFDWANTFPPAKIEERIGEYPVEIWWNMGLPCVRAVKDRKAGWAQMKELLDASEFVAGKRRSKLQIVRNKCPNIIKQLEKTMASPRDPDEIDNGTKHDHAIDSMRYGAMWRKYPVECPEIRSERIRNQENLPSWMSNNAQKDWI